MLPRGLEARICLGLGSVGIRVWPRFRGLWVGDLNFRGSKLEEIRVLGGIRVSVIEI